MTDLLAVMDRKASGAHAASRGVDQREEFGRLAAAELNSMYQLAVRSLGNRDDANDAVSEAILRAWASFDQLRNRETFRPWLMRIVVNTCRNDLRHKKILRMEPLEDLPRAGRDPFEAGILRDAIGQAMSCLGPDQRVVVVLRFWNDLPVDEIARVLGVPAGTVKWRLHAANKRIKAELKRLGWEVT